MHVLKSRGALLVLAVGVVLVCAEVGEARRRGREWLRGGRRLWTRIRYPIIANFAHRNPASLEYYNNPNGARIIKSSHFESRYLLGRKITFFCTALGLPRPHVTWLKDGIELYAHQFFQVHEWKIGKNKINSKMEIDPATQKDAGYYECQADNKYAVVRHGFRTDYDGYSL